MTQQINPIPTLDDKKDNAVQNDSIFKPLVVEESDKTLETKILPVAEETKIIATEEEKEMPHVRAATNMIFEITYLSDPETKQGGVAYTEIHPEFDNLGYVDIKKAFGCLVLREVVLNREVVERKCRQFLAQPDFTTDCKSGILIKAIDAQPWMFLDQDETKREFDKAVLDAFRMVQADVAKELHAAEIERARVLAEQETNRSNASLNSEKVPVHNPTYNLNPGDEGYNPNNDPRRRQKPVPVNNEQLDEL